jgi:uncharacterized protein (DUF2384 family)
MVTIKMLDPVVSRPLAAFSYAHRCYELGREQILEQATRTLGSRPDAEIWLVSRVRALNQLRPCCLIASPRGYREVRDVLYRFEYGIYT